LGAPIKLAYDGGSTATGRITKLDRQRMSFNEGVGRVL